MSDLEGVMLSDYLLLQCISKGGVADIYRARQVGESVEGAGGGEANYEVAVKVFRPGYAQRESFREYFMTEAEKIGQFDHPNILPFLEYGEGEDLLYLVTPLVTTGTLDDLLRRVGGRFSAMQALPIMQQLCSAVQYAHDHGVIHGNLKPTNVFVAGDGRMLLSDFGIARRYDDSQQSLTRVGWGSAEYAAPEQSLGVLRRSSDIYSLGVLLFRILTGSVPFTGQTPVEVLLKHVRQQPPSARTFVANISDAVDGVLRMALQKRSDDRFASAEEFSHAFLAAVTVAPVASPVARTVATFVPQPVGNQAASMSNLQTPIPTSDAQVSAGNPHTPIPPVAPSVPIEPAVTRKLSMEEPLQSDNSGEPVKATTSDVTEIRRKTNFLQESDDKGAHAFWSVDSAEWSPIAKDAPGDAPPAVPLTAEEYLRNKPVIPEAPVPSSQKAKPKQSEAPTTAGARMKKLLPVIVVILLLLGLLGAVFSTFFFPTDKPGVNINARQTVYGPVVATGTSRVKASPTHVGTATPTIQKTPGQTATVAARPPTVVSSAVASPTAGPVRSPAPTFSCTEGSIVLDGSSNFLSAVQQLTFDYQNQCANAAFTVNADGSKAGLDAVANGASDLAYSDLASTSRQGLVDYQVAALTYAVIVNVDAGATRLTAAQLQGIYTGKITNWAQVGGTDESVTIVTRPADAAIRAIFEAYVLKGVAQSVDGLSLWSDSSDSVVQKVLSTTGAISYVPQVAVPGSGVQSVALDGVSPSLSAVASGAYPFWSVEHLYSNHSATGLALSLINFCSTTTGENDLAQNDAVPIKRMTQVALSTHGSGPVV